MVPPDTLLSPFDRANVLVASTATVIHWSIVKETVPNGDALGLQELDDIFLCFYFDVSLEIITLSHRLRSLLHASHSLDPRWIWTTPTSASDIPRMEAER